MNPLTLVKRIQQINSKEAALGISEQASWHAKYKESAYVFVGGIPFDLTEGDLLAVFAQYGEIVDVNLVRDKGTGKSKGFAFIAYEDQRSTNLAVDNLNGAQVLGRTVRVDHVTNYKKREEEDEETQREKREARGVCRAFQKGECTRGAGCKFSHDEQRAANTGWGHQEDRSSKWGHDRFEASKRTGKDARNSGPEGSDAGRESQNKPTREFNRRDEDSRNIEKRPEGRNKDTDRSKQDAERRHRRHDAVADSREEHDRREDKRPRRHESESYSKEDPEMRGRDRDRKSHHGRDSSSHRLSLRRDEDHHHDHRSRKG